MRRVVSAGVAQIDTPRERDVALGFVGMPDDDELLVMRPAEAHALIQQHLTTGPFDVLAEVLVLLLAVLQLVQMRPPHQTLDDDAPFGRVAEQFADGRATVTHLLVWVTPPVREEQVIARAQGLHLGDEVVEVRRAVDQGLRPIALAPGRHLGRGITPFRTREEPIATFSHAVGIPEIRNPGRSLCQDRACPPYGASLQ